MATTTTTNGRVDWRTLLTLVTIFTGILAAVLSGIWAHAGATYATNDRVKGVERLVERQDRRLERIESKLDRLLEKGR